MAIGLSRLFGVRLPINFNSPYKATNIADFWRRWHMTLSRFLRDYLYIALGGNKKGRLRRYTNLMVTMLLGGLWHGAGWNFVLWGALHGAYLCLHQLWRHVWRGPAMAAWLGVTLTFCCVVLGWVFFRASSLGDAWAIVRGMAMLNGVALPNAVAVVLGAAIPGALESAGITLYLGGGNAFLASWSWIAIAAAIAFAAPNSQQLLARFAVVLRNEKVLLQPSYLRFSLKPSWAVGLALAATICVLSLSRPAEFLYFQF
jgi:hypothetical protein